MGHRFTLDELLERGPSGEVWAGLDRATGRAAVVKVAAAGVAPWGPARELAVAARGPRHPSLVRPLAGGELEDGRAWIATPRLAGAPLSRVLRGGALRPGATAVVLADLAGALHALHAVGVLHRDLKPGNVLLSTRPPPSAYLLDLGVASLSLRPAAGLLTGTPSFAAPEQRAGRACGPPTDVWGLGAVGAAALGAWPPSSATGAALAAWSGAASARPLWALLRACLSPRAAARPALGEMRRQLGRLVDRQA